MTMNRYSAVYRYDIHYCIGMSHDWWVTGLLNSKDRNHLSSKTSTQRSNDPGQSCI